MDKLESSEAEKKNGGRRIPKEKELALKVQENFMPKRNSKNYPEKEQNIQ